MRLTVAFRADAFDHVIGCFRYEPLRKIDRRDRSMLEAKRPVAAFAVEMDVNIFIPVFVGAQTQLISRTLAAVFNDVDEMMLPEHVE